MKPFFLDNKLLFLILFIILLDVLFGNIFSHYIRKQERSLLNLRESYDAHVVVDDVFGYGFRPLVDIVAYWNVVPPYTFRTNSLGFKDGTTRWIQQSSEKRRILFLGDSFTEGVGYPHEKTFVGRIGKELSICKIDVLNGSVHG